MKDIIAIIPARGGSVRLPGKNIMMLAGAPVIAHTIRAALECPDLSRIIVSTDDAEIAAVARNSGAEVIERPAALALSDSPIDDAYRHVLNQPGLASLGNGGVFVGMQANIPIRKKGELSVLIQTLLDTPWATAVATARRVSQRPEWMKRLKSRDSMEITPVSQPGTSFRNQDLPDLFLLDGAAMALRSETVRNAAGDRRVHAYLGDRVLIQVHDERYAVEIDEPDDFELAQFHLLRAQRDATA